MVTSTNLFLQLFITNGLKDKKSHSSNVFASTDPDLILVRDPGSSPLKCNSTHYTGFY
jgi:hypothetical protein